MKDRTISSAANPEVRQARRLEEDRTHREAAGLYLAWGTHLAQEALRAGVTAQRAFIGPRIENTDEGRDLRARFRQSRVPLIVTTTAVLESIVPGSGDQGILLVLPRPDTTLVLDAGGAPVLWLAAHGVQDPGNLGGLIRSAAALGASAVCLLEGCADAFSSRAVRAAMGAHFRIRIARSTTPGWIARLEHSGVAMVAADPRAGDRIEAVDLRGPTALMVGSEGGGLPAAILAAAARRARIPMAAGAESLNVHASAAILLYEAARQRGFPVPPVRPGRK